LGTLGYMNKDREYIDKQQLPSIGFIGQGWIGKHYADDFEERGYTVTRYALEEPYCKNKEAIALCDIVFIAVPTPTTPQGFSTEILEGVLPLVGEGKIAVIKSTVVPGTTERLQKSNKHIFVLHSPEFLAEATAHKDSRAPLRNIVGITHESHSPHAQLVLSVLPLSPYARIVSASTAEIIKYAANAVLFQKVVFGNLMYDLAQSLDADYGVIAEALGVDPRIGDSHFSVVHASTHGTPARGAGGHCFIKDYTTLVDVYRAQMPHDTRGIAALDAQEQKNIELLVSSEKDRELVEGVYGKDPLHYRARENK
jgi:UDPglucose 6-dehydrogenase